MPRSDSARVTWMASATTVIGAEPTALKHERRAAQPAGSAFVTLAWLVLVAKSMP